MKPLSSVTFIKGNIKRVLPIFISTILCVFLVYLFSILIKSDIAMGNKAYADMSKNSSILFSKNVKVEAISQELILEIKNDGNINEVIPIKVDYNSIRLSGIISNNTCEFVNVFEDDLDVITRNWDIKLLQGTLPKENKRELIIPEEFARASNISVGDVLKKGRNIHKNLYADYTVVGIYIGEVFAPITCYVDGLSREEAMKSGIIYFFKDSNDLSLNDKISEKISDNLNLVNYKEMKSLLDTGYSGLWLLYQAFSLIIIIVVAISLSNLNHLSFLHRIEEFKLYHSIGIKKSKLRIKVLKESSVVAFFGAISGMIFTILVSSITNILIFEPKGQDLLLYSIEGVILVLVVIIVVPLLSSISTFRAIGKCEYID